MGEITIITEIQKHNLDAKKQSIKNFAESQTTPLSISSVDTEGGFLGLMDHKVTGRELNERTKTIQENFMTVNNDITKIIREFREIYDVIEILDRDYITNIVANVKAIEKTSNDVRIHQGKLEEHANQLGRHQNKLENQQAAIKKGMEDDKKIIAVLKKFQDRLLELEHLTDVDSVWHDCNELQNSLSNLIRQATQLETAQKQIRNELVMTDERYKQMQEDMLGLDQKLVERTNELEEQSNENRTVLENKIETTKQQLEFNMKSDKQQLESNIKSDKQQLESAMYEMQESLEKELTGQVKIINENMSGLDQKLVERTDELNKKVDDEILLLKGKIKILYYALGGTAGLLVVQMILNALGVI